MMIVIILTMMKMILLLLPQLKIVVMLQVLAGKLMYYLINNRQNLSNALLLVSKQQGDMVDIEATLVGGSVYLAGELVRVEIKFTNRNTTESETLAWASAQIPCQCAYSEQRVRASDGNL